MPQTNPCSCIRIASRYLRAMPPRTPKKRESRVLASTGHQGATVSIAAREGHLTQAQVKWQHPTTRKRQRRTISGITLSAEGKATSREQKTLLQQLASDLHKRLVSGRPMPGEPGCPSWDVLLANAAPARAAPADKASTGDRPTEPAAGVLTVREALAMAYGPSYADQTNAKGRISGRHIHKIKGKASGGLAISTWTDHARDLRRLADEIEGILGPDAPWAWSEAEYRRLRDALIERVVTSTSHTEAPRKLRRVQKVLQTYIRATRVVQNACAERKDLEPKPQALTINRWLVDLKTAWTAAKLLLPGRQQPRYDRTEAGWIYLEGTSGRHDPRYALWLQLGMEGRPVQVLRSRRSHLVDDIPDTPSGVFRGPGTELKHGLVYAFTPAHYFWVKQHLRGYLSEYEARYQKGEIADYPLFPSGDLVDGKAPFRRDVRPWGYRQFLGSPNAATGYYAIEKAAGVESRPGRGPYALKYTIADLAPLVAGTLGVGDQVAINLVTGHDTPGTATQYRKQVREQPEMLVTVGKLIWEVRKFLSEAARRDAEELPDVAPSHERIDDFAVKEGGIFIKTLGGESIWVPWEVLITEGGQHRQKVERLAASPALWNRHYIDIDDDARGLRFRDGVTLKLEPLLIWARRMDLAGSLLLASVESENAPEG